MPSLAAPSFMLRPGSPSPSSNSSAPFLQPACRFAAMFQFEIAHPFLQKFIRRYNRRAQIPRLTFLSLQSPLLQVSMIFQQHSLGVEISYPFF